MLINVNIKSLLISDTTTEKNKKKTKLQDFLHTAGNKNSTQNNNLSNEEMLMQTELDVYLKADLADPDSCPLEWWKEHCTNFPKMANVAKVLLAVPASQSTSERIFSVAGRIVTEERTCLLAENMKKLVFIHNNAKI